MTWDIRIRRPHPTRSDQATLTSRWYGADVIYTALRHDKRFEIAFTWALDSPYAAQTYESIYVRVVFETCDKKAGVVVGYYVPGPTRPHGWMTLPVYRVEPVPTKVAVPGVDWDVYAKMSIKAARDREPFPVIDWMQEFFPEPWASLAHDPPAFFRSTSPYPLLGVRP